MRASITTNINHNIMSNEAVRETVTMTDRNGIIMEDDLNENDWEDVKARFHALKNGKYGSLWSSMAQKTIAPRSPVAALTEQVNGSSTAPFAATNATSTSTPTNMQVTVMATTSSCRCGCTPNTANKFLPSDMLQQENQPTATPATRWSPLLEDDDEEDSEDEEEEDSEDEESKEEESPQFHRRILEFDFENDNNTGVVGDEEGVIENDDQGEGEDNGDESADQDSDDSSSSGGSTVVAFNNVSFQNSPPSGDRLEHQDGLRSEDTDPNFTASLLDPESPIFSSPTHASVSSDATADSLNDDDNDTGFTAGNLNDEDTGVMGDDDEEADIEDDTQAQKEDDDGGDEYGDQDSENSSSSDDSSAVSFNNVSFYHSPASGGSAEHQDGLSFKGEDPNVAVSLSDQRSPQFSPPTRTSVSSNAEARSLNELPLRKPESPAFETSDEESVGAADTFHKPSLYEPEESPLYEPEESSPPLESPGIAPPAQDAAFIDAATGALNALSLYEPESPAAEASIIDAATGTLNEPSLTEPESPAFAPLAKVKEPEVIDLIDTSSDEERVSSTVIASLSKAIELVSSSDEKLNELPRRRKKRFVAPSPRPTLYDNSSSSSSEEMERSDARTPQSSFSDDNESAEEQSFQPSSSDDEKEDEEEDDSVEQLVQRTNRIVIASDSDSNTEDDSAEALRPVKRPPRKPKAKKSVSKAAFLRSREAMGAETFVTFDNAAFGGRLGAAKVTLEWSKKLRTTAGMTRLCKAKRPGCTPVLTASIELSTKVIDDPHRLRSTLLHEMCHAAAWLIDGVYKPSHGKCFQKWAQIAMKHVRGIEVTTTHDYQISFKYAWACTTPKCGCVIKRHSRSVDVDKHRCGRCQGKLMEIEVPSASNTSGANVEHVPKKKAPPSAYNLFVKENSARVREQLEAASSGKVPQPEVMKACARLWREQTPSKM